MKKIGKFDGGDVAIRRRPQEFQHNKTAETKSKGIVFQGWKRYEEAEEEE